MRLWINIYSLPCFIFDASLTSKCSLILTFDTWVASLCPQLLWKFPLAIFPSLYYTRNPANPSRSANPKLSESSRFLCLILIPPHFLLVAAPRLQHSTFPGSGHGAHCNVSWNAQERKNGTRTYIITLLPPTSRINFLVCQAARRLGHNLRAPEQKWRIFIWYSARASCLLTSERRVLSRTRGLHSVIYWQVLWTRGVFAEGANSKKCQIMARVQTTSFCRRVAIGCDTAVICNYD